MHIDVCVQALEVVCCALRDPEVRVGHRLALSIRGERLVAIKGRSNRTRPFELPADMQFMHPREAPKVVIVGRSFEM